MLSYKPAHIRSLINYCSNSFKIGKKKAAATTTTIWLQFSQIVKRVPGPLLFLLVNGFSF